MKTIAIALLAATPLLAHEFWLEPSSFRPAEGELLKVRILIGDGFPGEAYARNPNHFVSFVAVGGGEAIPVPGMPGADPAGDLRIGAAPPRLLGYASRYTQVMLPAEKFEDYLRAQGLDAIVALRASRGESKKPGLEAYARCAKAILGGPGAGYDQILGHALEIVPMSDPGLATAGDSLRFRLLLEGKPLAGALVRAHPKDRESAPLSCRTDERGCVDFRLPRSGMWMIAAVHMREATPPQTTTWQSLWASLTLTVNLSN